jgi:hypothetical protein
MVIVEVLPFPQLLVYVLLLYVSMRYPRLVRCGQRSRLIAVAFALGSVEWPIITLLIFIEWIGARKKRAGL